MEFQWRGRVASRGAVRAELPVARARREKTRAIVSPEGGRWKAIGKAKGPRGAVRTEWVWVHRWVHVGGGLCMMDERAYVMKSRVVRTDEA